MTAGIAVVGGPQRPVDAGVEGGLDQVGVLGAEVAVDPQPALERARDVQAADLVGRPVSGSPGRARRRRRPPSSQWRAATRKPSAFIVSACGARRLVLERQGQDGGGRSRRGAQVLRRQSTRPGLRGDAPAGAPAPRPAVGGSAGSPTPTRSVAPSTPRRQRAVGRPAAVLLEPLQQGCGQCVDGVDELLGLEYSCGEIGPLDLLTSSDEIVASVDANEAPLVSSSAARTQRRRQEHPGGFELFGYEIS